MDKAALKAWWSLETEAKVVGGISLLVWVESVAFRLQGKVTVLAQGFGVAGLLLALGVVGHFFYRRSKAERRLEQRRLDLYQAAAAGDTSLAPLADPQPVPDGTALSLPATFRLQRNWRGILVICGGIACYVWVSFAAFLNLFFAPADIIGWLLSTTAATGCAFGLFLVVLARIPRQWLEVTEDRLIFREGFPSALLWKDITLFAIPTGSQRGKPVMRYELLGSTQSFCILRPARGRLLQLDQPVLPFEEYDQQMEALLSVIAAKTGLALYDLR